MTAPARPDIDGMNDYEVARTLAAFYPTSGERLLQRLARWRAPHRVDNRFDRCRCRLQNRRARNGRHLIAKGRRR